jgi:hypothetical protein
VTLVQSPLFQFSQSLALVPLALDFQPGLIERKNEIF